MMNAFPRYPNRATLSLDGLWEFEWAGDVDLETINPDALTYGKVAAVPGIFDTVAAEREGRGVGVYRRRWSWGSTPAFPARLDIGALGLRGRVWWNGNELGAVDLPYSRAKYDLPQTTEPRNELVIAVDNRFDDKRSPLFPPYSDFYAFGGLYRSVTLSSLPHLRVERANVRILDLADGLVRLDIRLGGEIPERVSMRIRFDGGDPETVDAPVSVDGRVVLERRVPHATPWTPERPHLHTVTVEVEEDIVVERFGLRTIEARDGAILLNGKSIRLKGVNRHESHPQFGPVQPLQLLLDDLMQIKDLGCNFVRAVHYPHAAVFHDLCDEVGLLVWSESLAWGLDTGRMTGETARSQLVRQTAQMVEEEINHPSTILYGFLNECASDSEETESVYADLIQTIRDRDDSRLITYASNRPDRDRYFDLVDVVSVNLYPGWIDSQAQWPNSSIDRIPPFLKQYAALRERPDLAGKPLLLSEIGACGLYGSRDRGCAQWSEEYQAAYMATACRSVLDDPRWAGIALWQFCDTRSYSGYGNVRCKPRGFNCAGLVDEYRRPKLAYDAVRAIFRDSGSEGKA